MQLGKETFEGILTGKPDCFAIPHEFRLGMGKCDACAVRLACLEVSAQMFKALKVNVIKGRSKEDIPYKRVDGQAIIHPILQSAPDSSWYSPCKLDALPQLFDHAMRAYTNRPPERSVDKLVAELEVEFNEPNRHDEGDTGVQPPDMPASMITGPHVDHRVAFTSAGGDSDAPRSTLTTSHVCTVTLERDPRLAQLLDDCCVKLEDASDSLLEILPDDGDGDVDDLLESVDLEALRAIARASTTTTATPALAEQPSASPTPSGASAGSTVRSVPISSADHAQLMADLHELLRVFNAAGLHHYTSIRERFIDLNFQLNQYGRWAPRFRGIPLQIDDGGHVIEQYRCDRQLIDLHWLWATHHHKRCHPAKYETMLCTVPFDLSMAERFTKECWQWETKAKYLNLTTKRQWELCAIQSEAIRKRWKTIKDGDRQGAKLRQVGASQVDTILQDYSDRRYHVHIPSQVAVWIAVKICGTKKWTEAARLCALITGGARRDPRQIQKTFETVEKTLAKAKA